MRGESPYSKLVITTHSGKREMKMIDVVFTVLTVKFTVIMRLSFKSL